MTFSNAELKSLGDVLENYHFDIPEYQRGYAWQPEQWQAMWRDLENSGKSQNAQHFTGMLLLHPKGERNGRQQVELVDGQQRLVTAAILSNSLRKSLGQPPIRYSIRFIQNDDLQTHFDFYATAIACLAPRLSQEPSSYSQNIKGASEYFDSQAKLIDPKDAEKRLADLHNRFKLFILEVSDAFDIQIAFETLNNRGKKLSQMELLKNRLIYLASILKGVPEDTFQLQEDIHSAWKGIYRSLGRSLKTQNDDDEFLLAHATLFFMKRRDANWLKTILFDTTFSLSNPDLTHAFIKDYVESLEMAAAWWAHIHAPTRLPKDHQRQLERLEHSGFSYFKPLIVSAYLRASRTFPEAVSNPSKFELQLTCVANLLREIERYVVVVFRLLGNAGSLGKADMESCAYTLYRPGRIDALQSNELHNLADAEAIDLVAAFFRSCVSNPEGEDGKPMDSRFNWEGVYSSDDVRKAIEQRFKTKRGEGFYNWHFTRIALVEYEESFRVNGNNPIKVGWDDFSFDETVEHIYPQDPNGKGKAYWDKHIPIDGRSNRNNKLGRALQNSIGNLLFLSRSANSSASNEAYVVSGKDSSGKRDRYKNASYSATEVANTFEHWNVQAIAVRGIAILKFVEKRWDISLVDDPKDLLSYFSLCFGSEGETIRSKPIGKAVAQKQLERLLQELG